MDSSHMRHDAEHKPNRLISLFLLAGAVALLAGCGGGSSSSDKQAQSGAASQPSGKATKASDSGEAGSASAAATVRAAAKRGSKSQSPTGTKSHDGSSTSGKRSGTIDAPGYQKLVENQSARPKSRFTPCNLVSKAQAQAIVGSPLVDPFEAPQGPTCIYRTSTGKTFITLAVQSVPFKQLRRQIRQARRVAVSSRNGYCGKFGQSMLYVPLSPRRVLSVAAPCSLAKQFAAKALPHL